MSTVLCKVVVRVLCAVHVRHLINHSMTNFDKKPTKCEFTDVLTS